MSYHPYSTKRKLDSYKGAAYKGAAAAYSGYKTVMKLRKGNAKKTKTSHRGRGSGSRIVTRQHDVKSRSTKAKSSKTRKWERFVKKIDKAINYSHELCCGIETNNFLITSNDIGGSNIQNPFVFSTSGSQLDLRLGNYSAGSATAVGIERMINDIRLQRDGVTSTLTTAQALGNAFQEKFMLRSAQMTISLENQSGYATSVDAQVIYVDIYECLSASDMDTTKNNYIGAYNAWAQCLLDAANPAGGTGLAVPGYVKGAPNINGITPYHAPGFGKYWKVVKYTRLQIDNGAKINYTLNAPKQQIDGEDYVGPNQVKKGKCKDLIIIVNPTFNKDALDINTRLCGLSWTKSYFLGTDLPGRGNPMTMTYGYS